MRPVTSPAFKLAYAYIAPANDQPHGTANGWPDGTEAWSTPAPRHAPRTRARGRTGRFLPSRRRMVGNLLRSLWRAYACLMVACLYGGLAVALVWCGALVIAG